MGREIDLRSSGTTFGNTNQVQIRTLSSAPPSGLLLTNDRGRFLRRATDFLRDATMTMTAVPGGRADTLLDPAQPAEFAPDPVVQQTSSGARVVNVQQKYKDIRIFQQAQAVRFTPGESLSDTVGTVATITDDVPVAPKCTAEEAVLAAARQIAQPGDDEQRDAFGQPTNLVAVPLENFQPRIVASFPSIAAVPTVLEAGPFGAPFKANLLWFPINGALRLTWEVIATMPREQGQFRVLVDTDTKTVLYCQQIMHSVLARGNVYRVDGGSGRQLTDFPQGWDFYNLNPGFVPPSTAMPPHWVDETEGNATSGNYVKAQLGEVDRTFAGTANPGVVVFDPPDANGDDQKILNIFYYNCFMHDYFYLLGFRETDGNFQRDGGGLPGDRVDARAYSGPVWGTANMLTPVDGQAPRMNMGLFAPTARHTAFDSTVVFHEFTHGVTNRLVGGPANDHALEEPQSKGMGEGWGDYFACTINNKDVVGSWVTGNPSGIRLHPYTNYPKTFADLGTPPYTEVHNIGEIWCATLLEVNRQLVAGLGNERRAVSLAVQLVVDALKLAPANPNFLQMRDAIFLALDHMKDAGGGPLTPKLTGAEIANARGRVWAAFAKYKMGVGARSTNGASLSGITPDSATPDGATPTPPTGTPPTGAIAQVDVPVGQAIPDGNPVGITSLTTVSQSGTIRGIAVRVDITHPYLADLKITLTSPSGRTTVLYNRVFSATPNLASTFDANSTPGMPIGESANGTWKLTVADLSAGMTGTLNKWGLTLT